ncbi:uncharacterized protein LOC110724086 [Chenopodium quinoa]|uniref:uncharacterized protein LOC110724086 n=1 Tax=Chenopodium quinoa TaxID=63459 RepID=UPI000B776328|nr:uncharacterized protein LOC110724086 [Chenopodium quinoa]
MDNLEKRKVETSTVCPLCKSEKESMNHLFRLCEISKRVWKASQLGIISTNPTFLSCREWVTNFVSYCLQDLEKNSVRLTMFVAVLWAIWSHRNDIVFRYMSTDPTSVMTAVHIYVARWLKATDLVSIHIGERQIESDKSRPMLLWRLG